MSTQSGQVKGFQIRQKLTRKSRTPQCWSPTLKNRTNEREAQLYLCSIFGTICLEHLSERIKKAKLSFPPRVRSSAFGRWWIHHLLDYSLLLHSCPAFSFHCSGTVHVAQEEKGTSRNCGGAETQWIFSHSDMSWHQIQQKRSWIECRAGARGSGGMGDCGCCWPSSLFGLSFPSYQSRQVWFPLPLFFLFIWLSSLF